MGLLDEAIKDHLELKRRHGADPGEVSRQEREAFGPGQMPAIPDVAPAATAEHTAAADTPMPADEPVAERSYDVGLHDVPEASEALPEPDDRRFTAPAQDHEPPATAPADRFSSSSRDDDIDWSEPPPLREEEPGAEAASAEDEDVLEETPEFLQETPEHDRLWFEQRPPKDFDF